MAKKKIGEILTLNMNIPLWSVMAAVILITIIGYFIFPNHRDDIKFVATLIGGSAAIYSAYYGGTALRQQVERERQKSSFEILSLLNRPEFVDVRSFLQKEFKNHEEISAIDLYQKLSSSSQLENAVTIVLGILEDASIAIRHEYVDEDILYKSIHEIVKRNFKGLEGYINQLRTKQDAPSYFIELEHLHNAWQSGKRLSDGKSLPPLSEKKI